MFFIPIYFSAILERQIQYQTCDFEGKMTSKQLSYMYSTIVISSISFAYKPQLCPQLQNKSIMIWKMKKRQN